MQKCSTATITECQIIFISMSSPILSHWYKTAQEYMQYHKLCESEKVRHVILKNISTNFKIVHFLAARVDKEHTRYTCNMCIRFLGILQCPLGPTQQQNTRWQNITLLSLANTARRRYVNIAAVGRWNTRTRASTWCSESPHHVSLTKHRFWLLCRCWQNVKHFE